MARFRHFEEIGSENRLLGCLDVQSSLNFMLKSNYFYLVGSAQFLHPVPFPCCGIRVAFLVVEFSVSFGLYHSFCTHRRAGMPKIDSSSLVSAMWDLGYSENEVFSLPPKAKNAL